MGKHEEAGRLGRLAREMQNLAGRTSELTVERVRGESAARLAWDSADALQLRLRSPTSMAQYDLCLRIAPLVEAGSGAPAPTQHSDDRDECQIDLSRGYRWEAVEAPNAAVLARVLLAYMQRRLSEIAALDS